ncbi:hypothetical protein R1sor_011298 [Riccia sorocarpa]|uniref:NmrA-like domain-containing protein n=1 Tax=Riccia sorocarpa TaxID=122646 RepID=A0ABD3I390_9MARC
MADTKSKVLIIGATGYLGNYLVKASIKLGHPTFILARSPTPSDPAKAQLLKSFRDSGVTVLEGDLNDHENLVNVLRQVDVVIATLSGSGVRDQVNILKAAKEAGTIKRFLPSEFANDVDKATIDFKEVAESGDFEVKKSIRREVEKSGIPYTFVVSGGFAAFFVANLGNDNLTSPPRDKVTIWGDGTAKGIFNNEEDIATFTLKAIDDPRTENKTLHIRPKENRVSQRDIVTLWEKKIGHTLEKTVVSEEELAKIIQETPFPNNILHAVRYSVWVKGSQNFQLDSNDVEATELYPDVGYKTLSEYLDQFI